MCVLAPYQTGSLSDVFTLNELKEKLLAICNEIDLLELLEINSEELLDRFEDKIEEKYEYLCHEFEDETYEDENME